MRKSFQLFLRSSRELWLWTVSPPPCHTIITQIHRPWTGTAYIYDNWHPIESWFQRGGETQTRATWATAPHNKCSHRNGKDKRNRFSFWFKFECKQIQYRHASVSRSREWDTCLGALSILIRPINWHFWFSRYAKRLFHKFIFEFDAWITIQISLRENLHK